MLALTAVCAGCGGGGGSLDAEALSKQAEAVQSFAAEGALLGGASAEGKTTGTFTREHAAALLDAAEREEASLRRATAVPGAEAYLRRLTALAATTTAALEQLGGASADEQRRLGARLDRAARDAERLAGS